MRGAILGDIVGSVYEFNTIKVKEFKFLKPKCFFTDDTVLTCAIAIACMEYSKTHNTNIFKESVIKNMKKMAKRYPNAGYGPNFWDWVNSENDEPYGSYANGASMRTSPVAYVAESLEEAEALAKAQAEVTHNHSEGIKGAQAITACIYLALNGATKEEIREYVNNKYYNLDFKIEDIRRKYQYDISAAGSVPQAIESFLEGTDFEDSIRNAICLGGDADTIAAMTGSISEAFYGFPDEFDISTYLPDDLKLIVQSFENFKKKENLASEEKHYMSI